MFGIRYLDLRVGYYSNAGFYINHDLVRIMPLKPVLKQIRKFMELTEEIVVVDFHRFPYPSDFSQDLHNLLTSLIYEELGEFAVLRTNFRGKAPSFNELWNQEKRLVIAYSDDTAIQRRLNGFGSLGGSKRFFYSQSVLGCGRESTSIGQTPSTRQF